MGFSRLYNGRYEGMDALPSYGCGNSRGPYYEVGIASWYGPGFNGNHTANGEIYDMNGISAAHKTLPFGTVVRVVDMETGRSVVVRINDRGPFIEGRIIDLSKGAAEKLGIVERGITHVGLRIISWSKYE